MFPAQQPIMFPLLLFKFEIDGLGDLLHLPCQPSVARDFVTIMINVLETDSGSGLN